MDFDVDTLWQGLAAFYLSLNVAGAVLGTIPGSLVEKKSCATLERFHFLLFFVIGAALIVYLHQEIVRVTAPDTIWIADLSMAFVAGLYLGNVIARRLRNAGKKPILALLIWLPVVNVAFLIALAVLPTAPKKNVRDLGAEAEMAEMSISLEKTA